MATTATLTLNTPDFTGGGSFSVSTTLYKAGTSTPIDQFTGIARVFKATATADISLVANGDYADDKAHKLYVKNTSTTTADTYILMEIGSNEPIGRLFPGDWMFIPVEGSEDFKATTSAAGMSFEWGLFHEG
tara:strand:+ start:1513 stop:1908 length:396 start_codon:yes stop_codon:yes gene_type:complete